MSRTAEDTAKRVEEYTARIKALEDELRSEKEARRNAEEALKHNEEVYRALVETSPDAITLVDLQGKIVKTNAHGAAIAGYSKPEELVGKSVAELVVPGERDRVFANLSLLKEKGIHRNVEHTVLRRDGTTLPVELSAALVEDEQGRPRALMSVIRDITHRRHAEQALQAERDKLINIFDAMEDGVYIVDELTKFAIREGLTSLHQ